MNAETGQGKSYIGQQIILNFLSRRSTKGNIYYIFNRDQLKFIKEIRILNFNIKGGEVPLWTDAYCLHSRDKLIDFLKKRGVECRKYWYPVHQHKPFKDLDKNFKVSSKIYKKLFWLPSSLTLSKKDILYVCKLVKYFYKIKTNE